MTKLVECLFGWMLGAWTGVMCNPDDFYSTPGPIFLLVVDDFPGEGTGAHVLFFSKESMGQGVTIIPWPSLGGDFTRMSNNITRDAKFLMHKCAFHQVPLQVASIKRAFRRMEGIETKGYNTPPATGGDGIHG